ncbi:MAG: NAD(P)H-binding protein [Gammaproteobacteria bacterium]|nr:NAD(P)H-binding protein [Gammaproteobacteria bacterium]MDH5177459.1 NAD(P)H-binding protein [Gammaproteobacteria bacterium]MDH5226943.1 NAD(P)H-binding protein [Gammaproteobacteria bacterium]
MPRTALIAGATGLVGSECLRLLVASRAYDRVIVVARRPSGAASSPPKVQEIIVDFAALESVQSRLVADDVFCALGTTIRKAGSQAKFREVDFEYPKRLAELTLAGGAKHFSLVSALGATSASNVFYSRVKGELEDAVRAMKWPGLCLLRPSVIAGDRQESRPVERLLEHALRFAPRKWRPVPAREIAAAMVATALQARKGLTILESAGIPPQAAQLR